MSKAGFRNTYNLGKRSLEVGLSLMIWEDPGGIHYCYSPALDLTGYGKTEEDAKESFEHTLEDFISYTHNKKTIFEELERLGWTVNKKKKRAQPPSEAQLLEDNENYQELSNRRDVRKESTKVELAL
jgi:hypothetical protein